MTNYVVTDSQMISLADAIREKGGTSASLTFPNGMISAISDISTGGDTFNEYLNKTLSYVSNSSATLQNGQFLFRNQSMLSFVSLPMCSYIYQSEFAQCVELTEITLSSSWTWGVFAGCVNQNYATTSDCYAQYAFQNCKKLSRINGALTSNSVQMYAFTNCHSLQGLDMPNVVYIGASAFLSCSQFSILSCPNLQYVYSSAFYSAGLQVIDLPKCAQISYGTFGNNKSLSYVNIPRIRQLSSAYAFAYCGTSNCKLQISMPLASNISGAIFYRTYMSDVYCPNALRIYLAFSEAYGMFGVNAPTCSTLTGAFNKCASIQYFSGLNVRYVGESTFSTVNTISEFIFPNTSVVSNYAMGTGRISGITFLGNENMESMSVGGWAFYYHQAPIVLAYSGMCTLGVNNYITNTIYVSASLIENYKIANNWSAFKSQFKDISTYKMPINYNNVDYSVFYGSTWNDFINSDDNTGGFYISNNSVYDSLGIKLTGIDYSSRFLVPRTTYYNKAFTINNVEYPMSQSMKWCDFMGTTFNKISVYHAGTYSNTSENIPRGYFVLASAVSLFDSNSEPVFTLDEIIENANYTYSI